MKILPFTYTARVEDQLDFSHFEISDDGDKYHLIGLNLETGTHVEVFYIQDRIYKLEEVLKTISRFIAKQPDFIYKAYPILNEIYNNSIARCIEYSYPDFSKETIAHIIYTSYDMGHSGGVCETIGYVSNLSTFAANIIKLQKGGETK